MNVRLTPQDEVLIVEIARPERRNAVDGATARALHSAFIEFDRDERYRVALLCGAGGTFCAGADLTAIGSDASSGVGTPESNPLLSDMDQCAPMGPTRLVLSKPVIAAIDGHAVAGGLELALWCDLRIVEQSAVLGVFCRRFGVPLIDGGTVRLPRIVGLGRALDLILTGRAVGAEEALTIGLATRVVPDGQARVEALALARSLCALPQTCMTSDRASVYANLDCELIAGLQDEFMRGRASLDSGEAARGAARFRAGQGRHGERD